MTRRYWAPKRTPWPGILAVLAGSVTAFAIDLAFGKPLDPVFAVTVPLGIGLPVALAAYLSSRKPILEITETALRYRGDAQIRSRTVQLRDVASVEWPGTDNIGLRLRSGDVVSISVMALDEEEQAGALASVRHAAERTA